MSTEPKIEYTSSIGQLRHTTARSVLFDMAIVERLERIVQLLEALLVEVRADVPGKSS